MKKKIFISGVSSGIGEYVAEQLLGNCEVYGCARNPSSNPGIGFLKCDLRNDKEILDVIKYLYDKDIDVFIFNAGIGYFGEYSSISLDQEKEMLQVNLWANMIFIKDLLPKVSERTKFIFIGSISSKNLFSGGAGYQASKFGLRGFVGSLSKEHKNRFFLINPKIVDTNFHKNSQINLNEYKKTALGDVYQAVRDIMDGTQTNREVDI